MAVSGQRRGERGYNLVVLVMVITVMNIMIAAMLPLWSEVIRHDKEEELIFRGLQYAEAIRVFQHRFQRFPTRLEELVEIKPRSIRQLWKDPMTEDGKWQLIFQGQGGPVTLQQQQTGDAGDSGSIGGAGRRRRPHEPAITPATGIDQQGHAFGPITGVYSRSTQKSIEIWNGYQEYDQWRFTVDLLSGGGAGGAQIPGVRVPGPGGQGAPLRARWIGRPLRFFGGGGFKNGVPMGPLSTPGSPGVPPPPPKGGNPPPVPPHSRE